MTRFKSMEAVKRANRAADQYWFTPETMRFFGSRIESKLLYGCLFVTSEQDPAQMWPRAYSVREANADGTIGNVGEFQGHATFDDAMKALHLHAAQTIQKEHA